MPEWNTRKLRGLVTLSLLYTFTFTLLPASAAEPEKSVADIQAKLRTRKDFHLDGVPLKDFAADLSKQLAIQIQLDPDGLKLAGVPEETPVTADFQDLTVNRALLRVLGDLGLRHILRDGAVVITNVPPPPFRVVRVIRNGAVPVPNGFRGRINGRPAAVDDAQLVGLFRPWLTSELKFVKRVCEPSDDQMRGLEEDGEEILKAVAHHFVQTGGRQFVPMKGPVPRDARAEIRRKLMLAVESRLPEDRFQRYARESEQRAQMRKRVGAMGVVARVDEQLFLSAEQREAICNALAQNWREEWTDNGEAAGGGRPVLPMLPDQLVLPHLSERQQIVWHRTPKTNSALTTFIAPDRIEQPRVLRRRLVLENELGVDQAQPNQK